MKTEHPPQRARQRGVAALETALSLIILAFVMSAGIQFGDAMVTRHRMNSATSRAARVCSAAVNADNAQACATQQVTQELGAQFLDRCQPLNVVPTLVQNIPPVVGLSVRVECRYVGGPWSGLIRRYVEDVPLLVAQSMMPMQN